MLQGYMIKRKCYHCGEDKLLNEFVKDNRNKSGYSYICRICHNKREKERRSTVSGKISKKISDNKYYLSNKSKVCNSVKQRKENGIIFINSFKHDPCIDCGKNFPPECMELDHVVENKINDVSAMKSMKIDVIYNEIIKCELVCAVCHRVRSSNRRKSSNNKKILLFRILTDKIKQQPCHDCKNNYPAVAMDFDHVLGIKLYNISDMWNSSEKELFEEINKCDIVCANCHRIRTKFK